MNKNKKIIILFIIFGFIIVPSIVRAEKTIEDGEYYISSGDNQSMVLDIYQSRFENGTNIELYKKNGGWNQQWKVEYLNNGYYKIANALYNDYVLDVEGVSSKPETNVELYKYNGGWNQQWQIEELENGNYSIVSRLGDVVLDVYGGRIVDGANIQIYSKNNGKNQQFKFHKINSAKKTVENGNYIISSAVNYNKVLDIFDNKIQNGTNIELYEKNNCWNQIWTVEYLNNGYYKIANSIDPNYVLDVEGVSSKPETNVELYKYNGGWNQQWQIEELENGNYSIISRLGNVVLDVYGGRIVDDANIQIYSKNNGKNQQFKFQKTNAIPLKDGLYKIISFENRSNLISIEKNYIGNNSNIVLASDIDSNGQKWFIKHLENGYYSIKSGFNESFSLDVGSGISAANNAQLFRNNDSNNQKWYIKYDDGNYVISSKINSKVITHDILDNPESDVNVTVENNNNSDNQRFIFNETEIASEEIPEYENANIENGYYTITSAINEEYSLDIYAGYGFNGTNVGLFNLKSSLNQIWYFNNLGDGYYSITSSKNPDISLDVANNSTESGTNIQIYNKDNSAGQQWLLKNLGDGYYTIVSKLGDYALDTNSVNISSDTNVVLNPLTYNDTQKFKINPYYGEKKYRGIDVSSHNGNIVWEEVAKNIDFAIIRLGYGGGEDGGDDSRLLENIRGCEEYNIPYGVYLYSYALNSDIDTTVEIEHARNILSGINPNLGTKVFFDMEDADNWKRRHGVYDDNVLLNTITDKFCAGVESYGYSCGIYANVDWLTNKLDAVSLANKYTIWVAIWPDNSSINNFSVAYNMRPSYNLTSYKYWQFTSNGYVPGINGSVDLNLGYDIFD